MSTSQGPVMGWDEWAAHDATALAQLMRLRNIAASNLTEAAPRIGLSFFAVLHENKHGTWA